MSTGVSCQTKKHIRQTSEKPLPEDLLVARYRHVLAGPPEHSSSVSTVKRSRQPRVNFRFRLQNIGNRSPQMAAVGSYSEVIRFRDRWSAATTCFRQLLE